MKKIVSILMSSALLLSVVGCSDNRYDDLERRVSALEEQIAETEEREESNDVIITQPASETVISSELTVVTEPEYQVYSLEDMTSEEIYNLLISFTADVNTGDTLDNYPNRFSVEPSSFYGYSYNFITTDASNYIYSVQVNVQTEMDGTITVNNSSYVYTTLYLNDYTTASDLYDLLYQHYYNSYGDTVQYVNDDRSGTSWNSDIGYFSISMYVDDYGNYQLQMQLPITVG